MINISEWSWEETIIRVLVCFMWGLFNSLINDLEKEVNNHLIKFAFDTKLEVAADTSEGREINQKELEACVVKKMRSGMKKKSKLISLEGNNLKSSYQWRNSGESSVERDVGVLMDYIFHHSSGICLQKQRIKEQEGNSPSL